ncbi:hypothetical protein [Nonlabens xiamenensis]|uniref:hypothetical protein n=1 Tax=Nonlabens xiamenensis TaxID=2341043 RepID=UPI000F6052DE|nr:hypothetical protein [Nonlabens xiamenensis]
MKYIQLHMWYAWRVLFYNLCVSLSTLALGRPFYYTIIVFLTGGFLLGLLAQKWLHRPEEYVFQNLSVGLGSRVGSAFLLHLTWALVAAVLYNLYSVYVQA